MAWTFAWLFGAGGLLAIITLALPAPADRIPMGVAIPAVAAMGWALMLAASWQRLPLTLIQITPALGAVLGSVVAHYGGGSLAGAYALFYFWVILGAFYFLPWRRALWDLGIAAAGYALVLTASGHEELGAVRWTMMVGTLSVAGLLLASLRHSARQTQQQLTMLAGIVEGSHDAVIGKALDGRITSWNLGAERLYGYAASEACGEDISLLVPAERKDEVPGLLARLARGEAIQHYETVRRTKDGRLIDVSLTISPVHDQAGTVIGASAVARDISEQRRLLDELEGLSRTDFLTGLANRRAFEEELEQEIRRAQRRGHALCVAIMDLDHFKQYNDTNGHPAGDSVLRRAARAWRDCIRQTDTIARFGGEEFAVLLPDCAPDDAQLILDRMRGATPDSQTCSAGAAYWEAGETAEALIARADAALYEAKRAGRDRVVTYEPPAGTSESLASLSRP